MRLRKPRFIYTVKAQDFEHSFELRAWNRDRAYQKAKRIAIKILVRTGKADIQFVGSDE